MDLRQIPPTLQHLIDLGAAVGIVTLVYRRGAIAQITTLGMQDRESRSPMRRDTIFRIASMSKPVTAAAAMTLVEQGKLALIDPIEKWLPELGSRVVLNEPNGPVTETHPAPRPITVFDLMTHRSGFGFDFTTRGPISDAYHSELPDGVLQRRPDLTADEWLARLSRLPLVHNPGDRWLYGVSTDALGALIARASGKSFGDYLKTAIFDPLGMDDTGLFVPRSKQSRLAALYARAFDPTEPRVRTPAPQADHPPAFGSGGAGLFSTVDNYLAFARMLLGRGGVGGTRVLSPHSVELMTRNWLTPDQRRAVPPVFPSDYFAGQGFGLNLSVVVDPAKLSATTPHGSVGSYGWPGGYGTWWQVDPAEDMVLIFMVQNDPSFAAPKDASTDAQRTPTLVPPVVAFANLAYGAIAR